MDRPPGLGQQSRGLPENPAQGVRVRGLGGAGVNGVGTASVGGGSNGVNLPPIPTQIPQPPPVPPVPKDVRPNHGFGSNSLAPPPIPAKEVVALMREALQNALYEAETQAQTASGVSADIKTGVTIDLSRKNIQNLPDEVIDIIKGPIERLALSHNLISSFPARFAECTTLRYLNVRNNQIREFPLPLCDLKTLEILDLGRNKLRTLPNDIVRMASLKVFSVQKNRIEELPLCIGDMLSLQVLKLDGNPIVFPPKEVLQAQGPVAPNDHLNETELSEITVTANIKRFLRQRSGNGRAEVENGGGDESSEGTETPRLPIKRVASGRFPIKVNGTDVPDLRSPSLSRPPPIPSRSHFRGLSQQNTAVRRPGVMPLTIGNVNERLRSNSETLLQASRADRPAERSRRMGIISKKTSDLGTLDETQVNNRFSHNRGLSHGSAMQGNGASVSTTSPATPTEAQLQRPNYVRRLSILPERRRESKVYDPVIEAAKGVLYSVFQIHPMIQMLMSLTNDGTSKRSSLEIVFYNTNVHVEELEQEIQRHETMDENGDAAPRETENVQRACQTLISAYIHVCSRLAANIDVIVERGDPRYIRTLLTLLYNSIMELRITMTASQQNDGYRATAGRAAVGDTIRPHSRENSNSVTPTAERPGINTTPPTVIAPRNRDRSAVHNPSNLRVTTDVPLSYVNGPGSARIIPQPSATPRSGESFASSGTSAGRGMGDFTDEDRLFEKIFLSLQKSTDLVMRTLPTFNQQLTTGLKHAMAQRASDDAVTSWKVLIAKCTNAVQQTEMLKSRLSVIKLKEPGIRSQQSFWNLCMNFTEAWCLFAQKIRETTVESKIQLPIDTKSRLRPIQAAMKETTGLIHSSPWSYPNRPFNGGMNVTSPFGSQSATPVALPLTPQSAALGPAVQATVPSTPQSATFSSAFNGNGFDRADALISNGGGMSMSRTGTMTTTAMAGMSSLNALSIPDGSMTPASMVSPGPTGQLPFRLNNGSKVAY